jgi:hypothetical protein
MRNSTRCEWRCDQNAKTVIVPVSVTKLPESSFVYADKMEILRFEPGSRLRRLGHELFVYCRSLKSICIPASVEVIDGYCFQRSVNKSLDLLVLESVTFEAGSQLRAIKPYAFYGCGLLTQICLPPLVEIVDGASFAGCGLSKIELENGSEYCRILSDCLVGLKSNALLRYFGENPTVWIPEEIEFLACGCFEGRKSISSVTFAAASKVTSIQERAFIWAGLSSICIPSLVTSLEKSCFESCISLETVSFSSPSNLTTIGTRAFHGCSLLKSLLIPSSVELLNNYCFSNCHQLASVLFPLDSRLIRIGVGAFTKCLSLTSFSLPSSVEILGSVCFDQCHSLSDFRISSPSKIRDVRDLPSGFSEIPDSVELLQFKIQGKKQTQRILQFGTDSKLTYIDVFSRSLRNKRCFLRVSTGTLKRLRSQFEF